MIGIPRITRVYNLHVRHPTLVLSLALELIGAWGAMSVLESRFPGAMSFSSGSLH
jgi:hypothetical protein